MKLVTIRRKFAEEFQVFRQQKISCRRLWNVDEATGFYLYQIVLSSHPGRILEIGTSNGYSTFWLSLASEEVDALIDTVEVDAARQASALANLKGRKNIIFYLGLAERIIPSLQFSYDLVFLDANKADYISYLKLLLPLLNNNALIIADNVISHRESVHEYLDFIVNNPSFVSETLNIGDGLEITRFQESKEVQYA
ncbi:MAG: class I SAM-dependent methyltransferase [Candidatus Cloacimonetes bacterium]|nr:class I SAM-dependent methyltransferase [Candidatus Cloacimonadota bacterium]